jgi:fido (protein-threonine AMPylation protein)
MQPDDKLLCSPDEKANREIANQANVIDYLADFVQKRRTRITEADVLQIHALTIDGIYPCAGNYRNVTMQVEITDTDHKPSQASQVKIDTRDMLEWLYNGGRDFSPVYRAAYVMWKINAIHPFNGGKPEYVAGLKAADKGDLTKLEKLVLECFQSQFSELAQRPLRQ